MAVTARDVAQRVGVSVSTVSRALTRPDMVSPITRRRVAEAANELGYHANLAARSLSTGRASHIGLVIPDLENPFFASVAKGVQSYARQIGYAVFIADTDENPAQETELVSQLSPQVDGVILCSPRSESEVIYQLIGKTPLVLLNRPLDGINSISLDSADGIQQAIRHLWALGHRIIGYAGGPRASWSNQVRQESFHQAMSADATMQAVDLGHFLPFNDGGLAAGDLALASGVTAVIAFNDLMAIGLIRRLRSRGLRVPEDLSVVGFDGIDQSAYCSPALTTVVGGLRQLGRSAVDALLNPPMPPTENLLPVDLIVRASTAEASQSPANAQARATTQS